MQGIDRRILYIFLFVVVLIPVIFVKFIVERMPFYYSEPAEAFFEAVEAVPDDKIVVIAADFGTSTQGENMPQTRAVMEHLMRRGKKFAILSFEQEGPQLATSAAKAVTTLLRAELAEKFKSEGMEDEEARKLAAEHAPQYGRDWCNWGFKTGITAFLTSLGKDIPGAVKKDVHDTPIGQVPMMRGVQDHNDIALITQFTGSGILWNYLLTIQGLYRVPIAQGCTGVIGPEDFPFYDAGQLKGILIGMKGAAEYEMLVLERLLNDGEAKPITYKQLQEQNRQGLLAMPAQSFGHLVIIIAIILGNLGLAASNWQRKQRNT